MKKQEIGSRGGRGRKNKLRLALLRDKMRTDTTNN